MAASLDAATLRRSMELYAEALSRHREELNSLNVFPVADGDTGTNMYLTQQAVVAALAATDGPAEALGSLARVIAEASLLGARGNSGVILSQVLRGLCERLPPDGPATGEAFAAALGHAAAEAVHAVAAPKEGTVLSVLSDAAEAAGEAAGSADAAGVADRALAAARRSLERTRDVLPELRDAGVVDAGGKGIVLLLDAFRAALRGEDLSVPVGPPGPVGSEAADSAFAAGDSGFEVQLLLRTDEHGVAGLRAELSRIGESLVVVGGGGLYNVHLHTDRPQEAVAVAERMGEPLEVSTMALIDRLGECLAGRARGVRVAEQACGLVAMAAGDGLARAFRSLGADVVRGDPGGSHSASALLEAVDAAQAEDVIVLPNHPADLPAAQRAAEASSKRVLVVPALSVPAGLAAATAYNPAESADRNAGSMADAAGAVASGSVSRAGRATTGPAGDVRPGDWVGVADGRIVSTGRSAEEVAGLLAAELASGREPEILTVVSGDEAEPGAAGSLVDNLKTAFAGAEVQLISGGQPTFAYLIGVE